ncbi:7404_t:CDS:2 [Paraglomus brasilianum]|uniref:7404_t:CDS:1 n=1 Tax=Paraglomus brasilianum TaxID=144538 RepID=A0A9N9GA71_9GLOM|nr:7404_t:CDS:2 [Paraglomus brasilianum]
MSNSRKTENILSVVHAEEAAEEEQVDEEPQDSRPIIEEECGETVQCKPLKAHLDECTRRVEAGNTDENCSVSFDIALGVEELFHFMHCVNDCTAPKLFAQLK